MDLFALSGGVAAGKGEEQTDRLLEGFAMESERNCFLLRKIFAEKFPSALYDFHFLL